MKIVMATLLLMLIWGCRPVWAVKVHFWKSIRGCSSMLSETVNNSANGISDGSACFLVKEAVARLQYDPAQERSLESSNARSAFLRERTSVEMYYDDTWQGYVGVWGQPRRADLWTVFLTLMLSSLSVVAGYWLFGRGSA